MNGEKTAYAAALLAVVGWGTLYSAAKPALREVTPLMIAFDRAALASLALAAVTCLRRGGLGAGLCHLWTQARAAGWLGIVTGVINFTGTSIIAMTAQQFLPASVNGLLNNLAPLWLALYAAAAGRARNAAVLLAGSAVAVAGIALVLFGNPAGRTGLEAGGTFWLGAAIALGGSLLIAFANVLVRRVMRGRDAVALTAIGAGAGALPLLVPLLLGFGGSLAGYVHTSAATRGLLLWLGLVSTAFNFALWAFALSRLPVTRVAVFSYLIPPLGVATAVLFLGEPAGLWLAAGTAAIVGGIVVAQRGAEVPR